MLKTDSLIIGGGASGLLAALIIHDAGKKVMVVEKESRIAKKILVTGNGRCNFSNENIKMPFETFHSQNSNFFQSVLKQFSVQDTVNLFQYFGLPLTTLEKGKMYPQSLQASSVVDILRMNLEERNIPVYLNSEVMDIKKQNNGFLVMTNNQDNQQFQANEILIACGGKAAAHTGSDGSIYEIVKKLGHKLVTPLPSLIPLKLDNPHLKAIMGVRMDALAKVFVDNKLKRKEYDEVLFTNYGISGPAILQLSREAVMGLNNHKKVKISLDLFSNYTLNQLIDFFESHLALFGHRSIYQALIGIIHKKLIPVILKESGITDIHILCERLSYQEKLKFYQLLKNWEFECIGSTGFKNAQTTIGGIDTTEVNQDMLESKLIKGLYFSGEVLDVDGDCGGYNLQWAWSSGYVAAFNMSQK